MASSSSASSSPNPESPLQSVSISKSVEPTAETLMLTTATSPILVDQFHNEIERRLYFCQLLSWAGIRLPLFVTSAMYQNGMYVSFMKILEDEKRKNDAMTVHLAAELIKYNTEHPKEDQDDEEDEDEDEEEDSDDENETGNSEEDITNQVVKKQKVTHNRDASTQTTNDSPITFDPNASA